MFATIASVEFLLICIGVALTWWGSDVLIKAGTTLRSNKEAFQWLSLACVAALVFSLRWAHEILVPKHEQATLLEDWGGFYMLKNRTLVGICYVVAGTCAAITIWIFGIDIRQPRMSATYFTAVLVVMSSALTLWYASIQLAIRLRRSRHKSELGAR